MDNECLQRSLTLPNDIDTVPQLNEFIEIVCEEAGFDMSTTMSLTLAIEEAVVNVMSYAYPEGTEGTVDIEVKANGQCAYFIISDSGTPFDPTTKEDVDTSLSAEERPIGGLGIFLVKQIMDNIQYERKDGKNILTLCKSIINN
jgi:anti-sigma regulatory factor (Ser/Thr protein kinase)